jgi:hypothetical protein
LVPFRFSTRGVEKHHKNFLKEVHVKNFLREKNFFLSFSVDFFVVFLAVSLQELKNTIDIFSEIRPENPKKSQKK